MAGVDRVFGELLPLGTAIPFLGMLASIAIIPLISAKFWHRHFGKVTLFWSLAGATVLIYYLKFDGVYLILHVLFEEYIPFILLISALYVVSCGIYLSNFLSGTPFSNTLYLALGTPLASLMGTTGASMVLIGPYLRANAWRRERQFMVVFYIFLISNIGGSLTPLGDPPLFLGFLKGIPFFWTLNLLFPMLLMAIPLLVIYYLLDRQYYRKELSSQSKAPREPLRLEGTYNFLLILLIISSLIITGNLDLGMITIFGFELEIKSLLRDLILLVILLVSHFLTPIEIKGKNEFSWFPIKEVAILFIGLFITMIPAVQMLLAGEKGPLGSFMKDIHAPYHYFFGTGIFSAFLDNAPTYLTFLSALLGKFFSNYPDRIAVEKLVAEYPQYLLAISCGAVFWGAFTYIGNAPNFIIKSIAEEQGVRMPTFLGFIFKYSLPILLPLFLLISIIFLRG